MGRWDAELVPLLPPSVKIFASAGAGYDWADVDVLAANGRHYGILNGQVYGIRSTNFKRYCVL